MVSLSEIDDVISRFLRPKTPPLAIRMLGSDGEIPGDAKNPAKEYKARLSLCQALALSRMEGLTLVLDRDSQSCPIALAGLGFVDPEEYLSGKFVLAPTNQSVEARKRVAASMPRFPFGKYRHILISPARTAGFDPDLILLFGNSAQVMRMVQAAVFASGEAVNSRSVGSGGCLMEIVAPVLEGKCRYCLPGNGERRLGLAADGEMAFAMPRNSFDEVIAGLKLTHEGKQTYPINPGYLKLEYQMPPSYVALRDALLAE